MVSDQEMEIAKYRFEVRYRFEHGEKLQYRTRGSIEWKDATWCKWEWGIYEYRIKPEVKEVKVPIYPYLTDMGIVVWANTDYKRPDSWTPIERFVTKDKVRHAVIRSNGGV